MIRSDDDRALASGIIGFIAIIVIAALLFTLMNPAAGGMFDTTSDTTDDATAQDVIDEREQIWKLILFYPLLLAGVFVIARAVFESRRGI